MLIEMQKTETENRVVWEYNDSAYLLVFCDHEKSDDLSIPPRLKFMGLMLFIYLIHLILFTGWVLAAWR